MRQRKTPVKVMGLQRSGTNYLDGIVQRNFQMVRFVPYNVLWKHAPVSDVTEQLPLRTIVLVVHKNPYSWVESLTRSAKDLWKFHDLSGPKPMVKIRRGNYQGAKVPASVRTLGALYTEWHTGWLDSDLNVVPIRFEQLISDPGAVVSRLTDLGLERSTIEIETDFEVNQGRVLSDADRNHLADPTSFELPGAAIREITDAVPAELWERLGHRRLPAD